jgi:hypothetical protein
MTNSSPATRWPTRDAYDAAMLEWRTTLFDPELRQGTLARDAFGIRRYGGAGLYVCVYRIDDWLVRCFRANPPKVPPGDIEERYAVIHEFSRKQGQAVSAFIPITLQGEGLRVRDRVVPIVKMPFVRDALSLGSYISRHVQDRTRMGLLTIAWLKMIREMEAAPMAHGDLDLTNILVQERNGQPHLYLIDYDNVWLPMLDGRRQTESGHEHFQHPAFLPPRERPFGPEMDRFSSLVIFLSLAALNQQPELYSAWEADESTFLLLLRSDYVRFTQPEGRIGYLRRIPGLAPYVEALCDGLRDQVMPPSITTLAQTAPVQLIMPNPPPTVAAPAPPAARKPRSQVDLRPKVMQNSNGQMHTFVAPVAPGQPAMPPFAAPPAGPPGMFSPPAGQVMPAAPYAPTPDRATPITPLYAATPTTPPYPFGVTPPPSAYGSAPTPPPFQNMGHYGPGWQQQQMGYTAPALPAQGPDTPAFSLRHLSGTTPHVGWTRNGTIQYIVLGMLVVAVIVVLLILIVHH